jgi:hypothetical protein
MDYYVELWGSHKDLDNDDCITGGPAATIEEARALLAELKASPHFRHDWAYVCIDGPNGREYEESREIRAADGADDDALSEFAQQHGMAFGTLGYNEAMGFDGGAPDEGDPGRSAARFGRR